MENNKPKDIKHSCIMEDRVSKIEEMNFKLEVLKILLTPKMVLAVTLAASFLIQVCKGG